MIITNVAWAQDHQHRRVLVLNLDNHPAHILSAQRVALTSQGLVKGVDFLASERHGQADHTFIQGPIAPGLTESDLTGCTDDPGVVALYNEMCDAIRDGTWRPGPRALP
jgi:hypothetical protein